MPVAPRRGGMGRVDTGLVQRALPARAQAHLEGYRAVGLWPEVAGVDTARRSAAIAYRDRKLVVEVKSSGWLYQLAARRTTIVRALNVKLGAQLVDDLILRVNPRVVPNTVPVAD